MWRKKKPKMHDGLTEGEVEKVLLESPMITNLTDVLYQVDIDGVFGIRFFGHEYIKWLIKVIDKETPRSPVYCEDYGAGFICPTCGAAVKDAYRCNVCGQILILDGVDNIEE